MQEIFRLGNLKPQLPYDIISQDVWRVYSLPYDISRGAEKIPRTSAKGHEYSFLDCPIAFPDRWECPAKTTLTSESILNCSTHIVCDSELGRLRTHDSVEAERIQGFNDNESWQRT